MRGLQTGALNKMDVKAGDLVSLNSTILASSEVEICRVFLAFHLDLTYPLRVCGYFWLFRIHCTDHRSEKLQLAKTSPHLAWLPVCEGSFPSVFVEFIIQSRTSEKGIVCPEKSAV